MPRLDSLPCAGGIAGGTSWPSVEIRVGQEKLLCSPSDLLGWRGGCICAVLRFLGLFHDAVGTVRGCEAREGTRKSRTGGGWIARGLGLYMLGESARRQELGVDMVGGCVVICMDWMGCRWHGYPEIMNGESPM